VVVFALSPVTFKWKEPLDTGTEGTQDPIVAYEVKAMLPEEVTEESEEWCKGVKYNVFIPQAYPIQNRTSS
jgi:hypothetical protein